MAVLKFVEIWIVSPGLMPTLWTKSAGIVTAKLWPAVRTFCDIKLTHQILLVADN